MMYDDRTGRYYPTVEDQVKAEKDIKAARKFKREVKRAMIKNQTRLENLIAEELYGKGDIH